MPKLETSLEGFTKRESPIWMILSAVIVISSLILLVVAASAGYWFYAALNGIVMIAALVLAVSQFLSYRRAIASADGKQIDWHSAQPDVQRQNLNVEVLELSKILEVGSEQIHELQSAYIVAEDLALRQIQQEENVPLMRHVTVGKAAFDAVMVKNDVISCIDVSFLVVPDVRQEKIDAMMKKIGRVKKTFAEAGIRMRVRLMMVLVTQLTMEDNDRLRMTLDKQRFEETPVDIDINLLDFESLQKIFMTE